MKTIAIFLALAMVSPAMAQKMREDNRTVGAIVLKDDLDARLAAFVEMAEGEYRGHWPGAFAKRPDVPEIDAWAVFRRVDAPQFSPVTLYQEVREGGPDGRIVRQRIIAFDTASDRTHNLATFYPIMDPNAAPRADIHPERLASLSPANLPYFGRGCQMNLIGKQEGFRFLTAPTSCVIPYPDGRSRYTGMEMTFSRSGFTFQEAAYGVDGEFWAGRLPASSFQRLK